MKHETPLLDQLQTGPWPSFVSDLKREAESRAKNEKGIEEFLNIDTQFKYDMKHENHMTHMGILLLAKACEACGYKCIEWSRVSFPVKSMITLTQSGAIIDSTSISNLNDITALWNCHAAGVQMMMKHHEEQAQP